jgi:hypothetical protein
MELMVGISFMAKVVMLSLLFILLLFLCIGIMEGLKAIKR